MALRPAVNIRDETLVRELDTRIEAMRNASPGLRPTREGLARQLLHAALEDRRILRQVVGLRPRGRVID